jgi:uncharacterized protein YqhQ
MDKKSSAPVDAPYLQYGGQAVIEGVMMRSPRYFAVACRTPDGGIVSRMEEVDKSIVGKLKWLNKPFLRGTLALIDAMALGMRALAFASNVQMEAALTAEEEKRAPTPMEEAASASVASLVNGPPVIVSTGEVKSGRINDIAIGGTIVLSLLFGVALFVALPTLLTDLIAKMAGWNPHAANSMTGHQAQVKNLVDGVIKMVIFFAYIAGISLMPQIRAVFEYHGAEHKAINTLEAGKPLNFENALASSRIHPRCGTSFIFIVLVINLLVFAFLPRPPVLLRIPLHLAVVPIVAGIGYEIIKFAGRFRSNGLVTTLLAPGMWSQYLTTREPRPDQVEIALTALKAVLEAEGHRVEPDGRIPSITEPNPLEPAAVTA